MPRYVFDLQSCEESVKLLKGRHSCAVIGGRKLCAALRGPRSEALRLAQAVALEAVEALEALARMLRSTPNLISMAHGTGALFSSAQDCQALELMLGGQVVALEALKAQALTLSSTPGLISLALALVHSSAQDCQAAALDALGRGSHVEQHAKLDQPGTGALAQGAP